MRTIVKGEDIQMHLQWIIIRRRFEHTDNQLQRPPLNPNPFCPSRLASTPLFGRRQRRVWRRQWKSGGELSILRAGMAH